MNASCESTSTADATGALEITGATISATNASTTESTSAEDPSGIEIAANGLEVTGGSELTAEVNAGIFL